MASATRHLLSKSDFKTARECPAKLFFKKQRYPSKRDEDSYLAFLADGGFMVETMARELFPEGRAMEDWSDPEAALAGIREAVEAGDGAWFEPTVHHGGCLARIDILVREGRILKLIEIKSASSGPVEEGASPFRGSRGGITSKWRPYLEDVTFQALVLQRCFPDFEVRPHLCVVDKGKTATANSTFDQFRMVPPAAGEPRWNATFAYLGDAAALRGEHLLAFIDVSAEVAELREEVDAAVREFAASLRTGEPVKLPGVLGYGCKKCEYRTGPDAGERSGFAECWGELATMEPHVLDLYRVDLLGGRDRDVVAEMARAGRVDFAAIPEDAFRGDSERRQRIQIDAVASGEEWVEEGLRAGFERHAYPLHFIDFEGSRLALPYHVGMRPYEQVGFQWSCHTIEEPGGEIRHTEWLNDEEAFPNFEFAQTLRSQIGQEGTVYIWSPYEITMLRDIREQMDRYGEKDPALAQWLEDVIGGKDDWVIDLCALAKQAYLHPAMKGSVSIKAVFPAVWKASPEVRALPCFTGFGETDDPYKALPPLPVGGEGDEEVVREGTGAIRIYQDLMFGLAREDAAVRANYRKLLLQYCHLDTAAMVAIWWHWSGGRAGSRSAPAPVPAIAAAAAPKRGWFSFLRR